MKRVAAVVILIVVLMLGSVAHVSAQGDSEGQSVACLTGIDIYGAQMSAEFFLAAAQLPYVQKIDQTVDFMIIPADMLWYQVCVYYQIDRTPDRVRCDAYAKAAESNPLWWQGIADACK